MCETNYDKVSECQLRRRRRRRRSAIKDAEHAETTRETLAKTVKTRTPHNDARNNKKKKKKKKYICIYIPVYVT